MTTETDDLIYIPGEWQCPVCCFMAHRRILYAQDGSVAVNRNETPETCPNDGTPLEKVTYKQEYESARKVISDLFKQIEELKAGKTTLCH